MSPVDPILIGKGQEKCYLLSGVVDRVLIRPPSSRIGPADEQERAAVRSRSPVGDRYDESLDRESAAGVLHARAEKKAEEQARPKRRSNRQSPAEAAVKSFLRSVSTVLGREIVRGVMGALKKGR